MIDNQATAARGLKNISRLILQDLEALPEEAFAKSFGPSVRTVADIVYEVNLVNEHVFTSMQGQDAGPWPDEGWIKAPPGFQDKATVIAGFRDTSEKVIALAESYSQADIERTITTENGDRTLFQQCQFMTLHMWYHAGQINFIQTLLGDTEWHWK